MQVEAGIYTAKALVQHLWERFNDSIFPYVFILSFRALPTFVWIKENPLPLGEGTEGRVSDE